MPVGGHNPFEPAALGSAILYGSHIGNFPDIYQRLSEAGGAIKIASAADLATSVAECLKPHKAASLAKAAWAVSSEGSGVTETVMNLMAPYLDKAAASADTR